MRVLGIDLGSKRIGVALSDSGGTLATPYEVVQRSGNVARDHRRLLELAEEAGVECIVVGLPLSLDGSIGPAARAALDEVAVLGATTDLPVETYDERLTTVTADRSLMQMKVKGDARRRVIDKLAAAVMLQAWLDSRPPRPPDCPEPEASSVPADPAGDPTTNHPMTTHPTIEPSPATGEPEL